MTNIISKKYIELITRFKLEPFKDIIIFFAITITLHAIWRIWVYQFDFLLFGKDIVAPSFEFLTDIVRNWAAWVANHILQIETHIEGEVLVNNGFDRLGVIFGCSGLKQFYQFTGLMLLFPGPWKKKLWFIPLGIFIIHLTNVFRIVVLYVIVIYKYHWFDFSHDWILRPFFYVVMFLLWVWWVEKLMVKKEVAPE